MNDVVIWDKYVNKTERVWVTEYHIMAVTLVTEYHLMAVTILVESIPFNTTKHMSLVYISGAVI